MFNEDTLRMALTDVLKTGEPFNLVLTAEEEKTKKILEEFGWKEISTRVPKSKEPRKAMSGFESCRTFYNSTIKGRYAFLGIPNKYTKITGYKEGMRWLVVLGGERIIKTPKGKHKNKEIATS